MTGNGKLIKPQTVQIDKQEMAREPGRMAQDNPECLMHLNICHHTQECWIDADSVTGWLLRVIHPTIDAFQARGFSGQNCRQITRSS
jgi:hypothetical protein